MKFTIDRSKWICGHGNGFDTRNAKGKGFTSLLNKEGFMCCLGQVSLQLGMRGNSIRDCGEPGEIESTCMTAEFEEVLVERWSTGEYVNSNLSTGAIMINDDSGIALARREELLKELFLEHGHSLSFFGRSVKTEK